MYHEDLKLPNLPLAHEGVTLRPVTNGDVAAVHRLLNAPGVFEGLAPVPRSPDMDFAAARTSKIVATMERGEGLQLLGEVEGVVVGTIGVGINRRHRHGGLGYHLGTASRVRGVASRMLQGLMKHCFDVLELHRLWAETFCDSGPSRRLMECHGFSNEGVKRGAYL